MRSPWWSLGAVHAAILAAGCNAIFGLGATSPQDGSTPDAAAPPDAFMLTRYIAAGDYDGDGLPNATDPCPADPRPQLDGDGDGVGDACDPHPATTDCVVLFEAFEQDDPRWRDPRSGGPTWQTACHNGRGRCSVADAQGTALLAFSESLHLDALEVGADVSVLPKGVGATLDVLPGMSTGAAVTGRACGILEELDGIFAGDLKVEQYDLVDGVGTALSSGTAPQPFAPRALVLRWVHDRAEDRCGVIGGPSSVDGAAPGAAAGHVAIRAVHAALRLDYVLGFGARCAP